MNYFPAVGGQGGLCGLDGPLEEGSMGSFGGLSEVLGVWERSWSHFLMLNSRGQLMIIATIYGW